MLRGATARGVQLAARAILGLPARFARGAVRVGGAGHVFDKAKHFWLWFVVCVVWVCVFIIWIKFQINFQFSIFFLEKHFLEKHFLEKSVVKALLTNVQSKLL